MEKKELMAELDSLKTAIQEQIEAKAATAAEAKVKALKTEVEALIEKAAKDNDVKAEFDALKLKMEETVKGFNDLQTSIKVAQKSTDTEKVSFKSAVNDAIEKSMDNIIKWQRGETQKVSIDLNLKAVADMSTANVTGGTVYGAIYKPGIVMLPNQIGHIRSALNVVPAGAGTDYYFMKETGGEGDPAPTAEKKAASATDQASGLKPQFDMDLAETSVKFETIAGYVIASRKSINNIPAFQNFLTTRMPEKLMDVEDAQILYGDGTSPNLKGILTSGNRVVSTSASTNLADRIIDDLSALEDTYKRAAAAVWVRPADYWSLMKQKASGGSEEYNLPQNIVFVNGVLYISGIPVFKTTALTSGDYVVAAAGGADILQQEAMRIEFFNQHASVAATNQVMIRIEETIALPVYGGNYFIQGSSDFGS